jgi:conjugal transfer mating pair stabilization protein TraG
MAYTGAIYSFGDIDAVLASLNAIAMVFGIGANGGNGLFNGSLVALAGLIALMFTILPAAGGQKPNYLPFFSIFFLYFVGIQMPMTLEVTDYYTGDTQYVDNIPVIVGMPASMISKISYELSNVLEKNMATTTTTKTFREGGFSDPLKLLYALRPVDLQNYNVPFSNSIKQYIADCARWSTGPAAGSTTYVWNAQTALTAPTLTAYILSPTLLPVKGMTIYYSQADPDGIDMLCGDVQQELTNISNSNTIFLPDDLNALIGKINPERHSAVPITPATAYAAVDDALTNIGMKYNTASVTSQQFMANMVAMQPIVDGVHCKDADPQAFQTCLSRVQIFTAREQGRIDSAAGASIFAKTAVPMMNILMILFFLFSPILLIVALMMPHKITQILGGYIMFAVWTQSWLPTAVVINYIINMQATEALSKIADHGVNALNVTDFYETVATKIGLASELFAMTPMLTMALLSGSVYGLTQVSGSMSNKDKFDEKATAPDGIKTGAIAEKGAAIGDPNQHTIRHHDKRMHGGTNSFGVSSAESSFANITSGQANAASLQLAQALSESAIHNQSKVIENAAGAAKSRSSGVKNVQSIGNGLKYDENESSKKEMSLTNDFVKDHAKTEEQQDVLRGSIHAGLSSGKWSPVEFGVALDSSEAFTNAERAAIKASLSTQDSNGRSKQNTLIKSWNKGATRDKSTSTDQLEKISWDKKLSDANSQVTQYNEQVTNAQNFQNNDTSGFNMNTRDITARFLSGHHEDSNMQVQKENELMTYATTLKKDGGLGMTQDEFNEELRENKTTIDALGTIGKNNMGSNMAAMLNILASKGPGGVAKVGQVMREVNKTGAVQLANVSAEVINTARTTQNGGIAAGTAVDAELREATQKSEAGGEAASKLPNLPTVTNPGLENDVGLKMFIAQEQGIPNPSDVTITEEEKAAANAKFENGKATVNATPQTPVTERAVEAAITGTGNILYNSLGRPLEIMGQGLANNPVTGPIINQAERTNHAVGQLPGTIVSLLTDTPKTPSTPENTPSGRVDQIQGQLTVPSRSSQIPTK